MLFFFKQKTAYEMRISDWSSDVCSSDLSEGRQGRRQQGRSRRDQEEARSGRRDRRTQVIGFAGVWPVRRLSLSKKKRAVPRGAALFRSVVWRSVAGVAGALIDRKSTRLNSSH